MKKIVFYVSLLFMLPIEYVRGQCLENSDFDNFCGTHSGIVGGCPYFTPGCVANWQIANGTPQIFADANPINNQAYMWSANGNGEGLFASYTFESGKQYSVLIRAFSTGVVSSLMVYAANGLNAYTPSGCGSPGPIPPSYQLIQNFTLTPNGQWIEYQVTFTANSNYSQFWFFPYTTYSDQANLVVDFAKVCPPGCLGTLTYNTGTLPTGNTRSKYINVGSGTVTPVTVSATANSNLIAGFEINFSPQFDATVSSGEFNARIEVCSDGVARSGSGSYEETPRSNEVPRFRNIDSIMMAKGHESELMLLYPNPARNIVTAELFLDPEDPVEIKVVSLTGAVLKTMRRHATSGREIQRIQIPLTGLAKGTYFVQFISKKTTKVRKIEKLE